MLCERPRCARQDSNLDNAGATTRNMPVKVTGLVGTGWGLGRVFYALATLSTSSTVVSPCATTRRPSSLSNFIPASRAIT